MLGEPGTEQFEVITEVAGKQVHRMKIHDPFVRTSTVVKGAGAAWQCLVSGLLVTTKVNGSAGAMQAVMSLDPHKMTQTDLLELAWGIIANAGGGDWEKESKDWQEAAVKWRDTYHNNRSPGSCKVEVQ